MSSYNNYYIFMGLDQAADIEVIKSVYRVLAKKYHPDHYVGSKEKGEALFRKLNKAFMILSNIEKRKKYDRMLEEDKIQTSNYNETVNHDDENFNASKYDNSINKAWLVAERIYPDINKCKEKLGQLNSTLAIAYASYLVQNKAFSNALSLSNEFQEMFLSTYFGNDKYIQRLAFQLIMQGYKILAVDLNQIIKVIGTPEKTNALIDKFLEIHKLSKDAYWKSSKIIKIVDFNSSCNTINNSIHEIKKTSDGFYSK